MHCPHCNENIEKDWIFCGWCGINIDHYNEGLKFLKRGKRLEETYKFDEAIASCEKAVALGVARDVVGPLLDGIYKKVDRFLYLMDRGKTLEREGRIKEAYISLKEAYRLNPLDDSVEKDLVIVEGRLRKKTKKKALSFLITFIVVAAGVGTYLRYINTPQYLARKTLVESTYSTNAITRRAAIEAMGNVGDNIFLPFVIKGLDDANVYVRMEAIKSLYKIEKDTAVEHMRFVMENDEDERVRMTAGKFLAELADSSAMKYIKKFVKGK